MSHKSENGLSGLRTAQKDRLPRVPEFRSIILPLAPDDKAFILDSRRELEQIIDGKDDRIVVTHGPCSVDDVDQAKVYIDWAAGMQKKVGKQFFLQCRLPGEKPRTNDEDWEGMIYEPYLDGIRNPARGIHPIREVYVYAAKRRVPVTTEDLDPILVALLGDALTDEWAGARSVLYQGLQNMASALSRPFGFKNDLTGDVDSAIRAIKKARQSGRSFFGIDVETGDLAVITGEGNPYTYLIQRGGSSGPNYTPEKVAEALMKLREANLPERLVIDCSHDNTKPDADSPKDYLRQIEVFGSIMEQILRGNTGIMGVMIEAYHQEGSVAKKIPKNRIDFDHKTLPMGVSRTDACISIAQLEPMLDHYASELQSRSDFRLKSLPLK